MSFWHQLGAACTATLLACLYLPRLLTIGTFVDGTTYAALARNMAVGYGSVWAPRYGEADSFWLEGVRGDVFYEHPPLMLLLESVFFQLLGDHWWVEEVFCGLVTLAVGWLVFSTWQLLFPARRSFGWLTVLMVGMVPIVRFCLTNNHLDGLLLVFLIGSFGQLCRALRHHQPAGLYWAGTGIFLGFLTKGPFALFLLAAPTLYGLTVGRTQSTIWRGLRQTALLTTLFGLLLGGLLLYPPAQAFFAHYLDQQLLRSLYGLRADHSATLTSGLGRFFIVYTLFLQMSPLLLLLGIGWLWTLKQIRSTPYISREEIRLVVWLMLVGLSGVLPLLISSKQHAHYVAPSIPFIAMALAALLAVYMNAGIETLPAPRSEWMRTTSLISVWLAGVLVVWLLYQKNWLTGIPDDLRRSTEQLTNQTNLPDGRRVAVKDRRLIKKEWFLNMNLQRFHRIALTTDTAHTPYLLCRKGQEKALSRQYFLIARIPAFDVQLWQRMNSSVSIR